MHASTFLAFALVGTTVAHANSSRSTPPIGTQTALSTFRYPELDNWCFGDPLPSAPVVYCTPGTTTNGCLASIAASANPNVAHSTPCQITLTNVEGAKTGIVFYGLASNIQPWWCSVGGNSFLCVKAPTMRTGV